MALVYAFRRSEIGLAVDLEIFTLAAGLDGIARIRARPDRPPRRLDRRQRDRGKRVGARLCRPPRYGRAAACSCARAYSPCPRRGRRASPALRHAPRRPGRGAEARRRHRRPGGGGRGRIAAYWAPVAFAGKVVGLDSTAADCPPTAAARASSSLTQLVVARPAFSISPRSCVIQTHGDRNAHRERHGSHEAFDESCR
jgi:hypothetical protein